MKPNDTRTDRSEPNETEQYDRRSFMAITGTAGGLGAFASGADASGFGGRFAKTDAADEGDSKEESSDEEGGGNHADFPIGTEALLGYIEANYGDRLSEEELQSIEADIAADLEAAAAVNDVPLENGDAPAFGFEVYRGEE